MNILLATDGSPYSEAAVREVARRPWPPGSTVKVVTALPGPLPPEPFSANRVLDEMVAKERHEAYALVARTAETLRSQAGYLNVETEVLTGPPKTALLDIASAWPADLIVVGSHGYGAVARFLLGSVSHALALHAPCSVEIVREREADPSAEGETASITA